MAPVDGMIEIDLAGGCVRVRGIVDAAMLREGLHCGIRHGLAGESQLDIKHIFPRTSRHRARLNLRQVRTRIAQPFQCSHQRSRTVLHCERDA